MKKIAVVGLAALLSAPMVSFAYDQGDMIVRAGVSSFDHDLEGVDKDEQLGVDFAYILTGTIGVGQFGIEGSLAMPVDLVDEDSDEKFGDYLPLNVTAQYYFNTGSLVTPYVGLGLNYSMMSAEDSGVDIDDSTGLLVQVGADFAINDNWGVNLNVRSISQDLKGEDSLGKFDESNDVTQISIAGVYKF